MRIRSLNLQAFGHFTDRTLEFEGSTESIHIVLGANEAGKSTALRAIEGFLYGIPTKSSDNYVHEYGRMRVGATLESAKGETATFVRRKGNSKTLFGAGVAPLPDEALDPYLCGVGRGAFEALFCLDFQRLSAGSEDVLHEGGELGRILFDARSKVALRPLLAALHERALGLYKGTPRARSVIDDAIRAYGEASKVTRKGDVREFKEIIQAKSDLEIESARLRKELDADRTRERRLRRYQAAVPALGKRAQALSGLAALGNVPSVPDGIVERYATAKAERADSEAAFARSESEILAVKERLSEHTPGGKVWEHRNVIERLSRQAQGVTRQRDGLSGLESKAKSSGEAARASLARVRPNEEPDEATLVISDLQKERLRRLIASEAKLKTALDEKRTSRAKADRELQVLRLSLAEEETISVPPGLIDAVAVAQALGDVEGVLVKSIKDAENLQRACEIQALQLGAGELTPAEFVRLPVPSKAVVHAFVSEYRDTRQRLREAQKQEAEASNELAKAIESRRTLLLGESIPTEAQLRESREVRELSWGRIRKSCLGLEPVTNVEAVEGYEATVSHADEVSDRLRRDAERVAQLEAVDLRINQAEDARTKATEICDEASAGIAEIDARWAARWESCGLVFDGPEAMSAWHDGYHELTQRVVQLQSLRANAAEHEADRNASLRGLLAYLGPEGNPSATLPSLISQSSNLLQKSQMAALKRQSLEEQIGQAESVQRDEASDIARLEGEVAEWEREWDRESEVLRLPTRPTPGEAAIALDAIGDALRHLMDVQESESDAQRARHEIETFDHKVREVADAVASTPIGIERLAELLKNAERSDAVRQEQEAALERHEEARRIALRKLNDADAEMRLLSSQVGVDDEDFEELLGRHRQWAELRRTIVEAEQDLVMHSAGMPLDKFCEEASSLDPDSLVTELDALEANEPEKIERIRQLDQHIWEKDSQIKRLDDENALVASKADEESALARIRAAVRPFLVYSTAEGLVAAQIEAFRQANQGPILVRAGEIFDALTDGSFEGLAAELDSDGRPVLVAVRRGDALRTNALSSATRVALYLSLRLACLYHHAESKESLPFIADDILLDFDDVRAKGALIEMGRLARTTQVILFTHHRHLADIGREVLGENCRVHEL